MGRQWGYLSVLGGRPCHLRAGLDGAEARQLRRDAWLTRCPPQDLRGLEEGGQRTRNRHGGGRWQPRVWRGMGDRRGNRRASADGLDPDMLVVPGKRPQVIGIAGGDESTAEPHARGDHERIHRMAGIKAVPGSQLAGEARHVMAHGDRTNPPAQDEVRRRVRSSTPIGLGQHGGWNPNRHPE
ncbi:MAG: hypothetical protein QOG97_1655, partial [Acidimicrobiaceae bacterium]|nr:hypothetical protein [Acidimicrobiaceae bacterium]